MTIRSKMLLLIASAAVFWGCRQRGNSGTSAPIALADASPGTAIRSAILAHLARNAGLNPNAFDTEVKRVTLDGDRAQAEVEFHVKNGSGVMQLTYALTRHNGAWSVVESTPMGSNFSHPQLNATQAAPPNAGTSADSSIFRTMDNFHGTPMSPTRKLPPGHPPIAATPKESAPQTP
jgi:hypothetical protein